MPMSKNGLSINIPAYENGLEQLEEKEKQTAPITKVTDNTKTEGSAA